MNAFAWMAAAAALVVAAPAGATTFVMDLATGGTNVGGSAAGNVRGYSKTVGAQTLTLSASGWTNAVDLDPDKTLKAILGQYSGGLGVTSPGESGSSPTHTVDNVGREDFIVLKFNTAVNLTSMYLNVYNIGTGGPDSDATVFYKNGATAPTDNGLSSLYFGQFSSIDVPGTGTSGTRTVLGSAYADTWLVSAKINQGTAANDGFKLFSVTLNTPAIPEPSAWAMMVMGFGGLGGVLRARRRATIAA